MERIGDGDPFVRGRAADVYFQSVTKNRITLEIMERVLESLAPAKGRKSMILVSEGFIYDPNLDEFKRVNEASRRANAAIYFVNARGLEGMPLAMTAQFGPALPDQDVGFAFTESWDAAAGSDAVADDSGGFTVRNTNDLSRGIQKIADETQVYYLLGYIPSNTARDGKFRKIQVKLANAKGREVREYDLVPKKPGDCEFGLPQTMARMACDYKITVTKACAWQPVGNPDDLGKAEESLHKFL